MMIQTVRHGNKYMCVCLTKWNTAGQSGALCLPPGGTVALHHTVVQQMARTSIGEGSTFKLHSIHLMDKTMWTESTAGTENINIEEKKNKYLHHDIVL